jgi:hypothetical protein
MEVFGADPRNVDIGFAGGSGISLRLREGAYHALRDALGSDRAERWHGVDADGAEVTLDLSQVVYVRLDTEEQRVGF